MASMASTGTCWLSMVRRRSTVRFRKGAPRSEASEAFSIPSDLCPEDSSGRNRSAARLEAGAFAGPQTHDGPGQVPASARECRGGILESKIVIKRPRLSRATPITRLAHSPSPATAPPGRCPARASPSRPHGPRCRSRRESIHASPSGRTRHGPPQRRGARAGRHHRGARRSG